MSNGPNHRRGHGRIQDHGPTYESPTPAKGCNSTHVARSRAKWKARASRAERRTGAPWPKFRGLRYRIAHLEGELRAVEERGSEATSMAGDGAAAAHE